MPDIAATRPAAGAVVESAWGQQVHDQVEGIQAGTVTAPLSASAATTVTVTFPRAYLAAPVVVASAIFINGQPSVLATIQSAPTTTSVVLRVWTATGANATGTYVIHWVAIGTPA
jgi:predicted secreted protein